MRSYRPIKSAVDAVKVRLVGRPGPNLTIADLSRMYRMAEPYVLGGREALSPEDQEHLERMGEDGERFLAACDALMAEAAAAADQEAEGDLPCGLTERGQVMVPEPVAEPEPGPAPDPDGGTDEEAAVE